MDDFDLPRQIPSLHHLFDPTKHLENMVKAVQDPNFLHYVIFGYPPKSTFVAQKNLDIVLRRSHYYASTAYEAYRRKQRLRRGWRSSSRYSRRARRYQSRSFRKFKSGQGGFYRSVY